MKPALRIDDDRLDRLGVYFDHMCIHQNYGLTFERFVHMVMDGSWQEYTNHAC